MELVYLWVEDYKNIHKQGFNFSPKFNCDFDGKNLTIKDNPDYIENFFGDNINVTAIVGENGSGKSQLLELIIDLVHLFPTNKQLFCIILKDNQLILNHLNMDKIDILGKYTKISQSKLSRFEENHNGSAIKSKDVALLDIAYITLSPILPNINTKENTTNLFSIYNIDKSMKNFFVYDDFFNDIFFDIPKLLKNKIIREIFNIKSEPSSIYIWFTDNNEYKINNELKSYIIDPYSDDRKEYKIPLHKLTDDLKKSILDLKNYVNKTNIFHLYFLINDSFETEVHFSSGELALMFYFRSLENIKENEILLIDECELYLHPNWQKKFLFYLIQFFKKKIQIILTTHSPFLLSDIPKQNIIFLDKDENGNCKVLKHDKVMNKKQTFGANIHTLLSDSFFMEDGLMGEFAKSKINEIKEFYEKV